MLGFRNSLSSDITKILNEGAGIKRNTTSRGDPNGSIICSLISIRYEKAHNRKIFSLKLKLWKIMQQISKQNNTNFEIYFICIY